MTWDWRSFPQVILGFWWLFHISNGKSWHWEFRQWWQWTWNDNKPLHSDDSMHCQEGEDNVLATLGTHSESGDEETGWELQWKPKMDNQCKDCMLSRWGEPRCWRPLISGDCQMVQGSNRLSVIALLNELDVWLTNYYPGQSQDGHCQRRLNCVDETFNLINMTRGWLMCNCAHSLLVWWNIGTHMSPTDDNVQTFTSHECLRVHSGITTNHY